ncbi:MAG: hypothetical protein A2Y62_17205 [Candidatus Fischerbacteria bacterium RBG_13_37_8]|uniref:Radical SAM core domain-containing protein n=1 Tax=Candidatus Fischerbacteria bacterium RBG_13_37_8 TaxID=1817863 RepID=A0A1F5VG55_9BACT|nr:MAG: hypothetical protein A2Y62_17205 [Candidatus Fischerbacteria bacterium RBG_13_37_8]
MGELPKQAQPLSAMKAFLLKAFHQCVPLSLQLELTQSCNLKCQFCYSENTMIFLETGAVCKVIDDACTLGSYMLALTGGEPLLHPDFFTIAEHGKKRGYLLIIQTNGIIIDENIAAKIAALAPAVVDISIHGAKAETHEALTLVKGSFDKAINAIKLLKGLECPVRFKIPVTKINQEELEQINQMAESMNCYAVFDPFISPTLKGNTKPLELKPDFSKLSLYIDYSIIDNEGDILQLTPRSLDEVLCGLGRILIAITAAGFIQPCMRVPITLGSIYKDSIIEVWHTNEKLKELRYLKRFTIEKCRNCTLLDFCFVCPGLQLLKHNTFKIPYEEACENAQLRHKKYQESLKEKNEKKY